MPYALISVTDKTGITDLAKALAERQFSILSTGGTARCLHTSGIRAIEIADFTQSPEMLGGRVKTLHPRVFGGILGRPEIDREDFQTYDLKAISMVVVNLYEFEKTTAIEGLMYDDALEAIDIGGVSLIRAAAKNHAHVLVVVDPHDYPEVAERIAKNAIDTKFRARMAAKAFRHTAAYDATIAGYLSTDEQFPERLTLTYVRDGVMRYGENPHQKAAFYRDPGSTQKLTQLQGKKLSYNNIADIDAALRCVQGLAGPACAIVKHANPCGLAIGSSLANAYDKALRTDPTSAFGGIVAFNSELDAKTLDQVLKNQFAEVIAAPSFGVGIRGAAQRKKSLRLVKVTGGAESGVRLIVSTVSQGALVQEADNANLEDATCRVLTEREPTHTELHDLHFAWHVVKQVKSNAIVFAHEGATVGIGAGQPNRAMSVRIAAIRMQEEGLGQAGCVMASDAFFPFRDGIDSAAQAGVTAVIQPAGSIRDDEVVRACNEYGIAMIATGMRHFKH